MNKNELQLLIQLFLAKSREEKLHARLETSNPSGTSYQAKCESASETWRLAADELRRFDI